MAEDRFNKFPARYVVNGWTTDSRERISARIWVASTDMANVPMTYGTEYLAFYFFTLSLGETGNELLQHTG